MKSTNELLMEVYDDLSKGTEEQIENKEVTYAKTIKKTAEYLWNTKGIQDANVHLIIKCAEEIINLHTK